MLHLSFVILLCLLPQAKSGECDERPFGPFNWKGNTIKAIDDCDILRPQMQVHLDRLTSNPSCLSQVVLKVKIYSTPSKFSQVNLGTPGIVKSKQISNFVPQAARCKVARVHISTQVCSRGCRPYTTTFSLNPQSCTEAKDVNFDKDCSGQLNVEPTSVIPTSAPGAITLPTQYCFWKYMKMKYRELILFGYFKDFVACDCPMIWFWVKSSSHSHMV